MAVDEGDGTALASDARRNPDSLLNEIWNDLKVRVSTSVARCFAKLSHAHIRSLTVLAEGHVGVSRPGLFFPGINYKQQQLCNGGLKFAAPAAAM